MAKKKVKSKPNNKKKNKLIIKNPIKTIAVVLLICCLIYGLFLFIPKKTVSKPLVKQQIIKGQVIRKATKVYGNNIVKRYTFYLDGKKIAAQYFRKDGSFRRSSGKIPDGIAREYYANNNLKAEANYKNNKRQGAESYYYENGPIMAVLYFDNEKLFPKANVYYDNGALHSLWRYSPETKSGYALFYFKDGRLGLQSVCNSGQEYLNLVGSIQLGS